MSFRLNNKVLLLTYKHHLPKQELDDFLSDVFNVVVEECYIAWENGDKECPYEHTHVAIKWDRPVQSRDPRCLDFIYDDDQIHPNIKPVKGKNGWRDICVYVSKEDPELDHLKDGPPGKTLVGLLGGKESVQDALGLASKWSDISGIAMAYRLTRTVEVDCDEEPHPWQQTLRELVKSSNRRRDVIWVVGANGNEGKSTWCRNRGIADGALVIEGGCTIRDLGNRVINFVNEGGCLDLVVFDLPRVVEERDSIYPMIECMKNGYISTTKYNGGHVYFNRPVVVVLSNWDPKVEKLSLDRWNIYDIVSDGLTLVDVTQDVFELHGVKYSR